MYGLEADLQFSNENATGSGCTAVGCPAGSFVFTRDYKLDWFGTARGRIGYLPAERILLYATGGLAYGNFSGDTNGYTPAEVGLYPDGSTYAASASIIGEYNLAPSVAFKLAPEYFITGFGSTVQASRGFTAGVVVRFGKQ